MDDLQRTIGAIIRRERRARALTLKELAERSIISVVYLGEIERGKKYPSPVVLERLAKGLELETPDLLELIADELRGVRQPVLARPIGFLAGRPAEAPTQPAQPGRQRLPALPERAAVVEAPSAEEDGRAVSLLEQALNLVDQLEASDALDIQGVRSGFPTGVSGVSTPLLALVGALVA
ncbi:MAG TPA: helix-turn-helix transcriptional regulator [Ktedonobacterales bacterium]|nr:helix-turn-helix transcriptional regulator [Ktedonobacterales bacterium]